MMKTNRALIMVFSVLVISSCGMAAEDQSSQLDQGFKRLYTIKSFGEHAQGARGFWNLIKQGDSYREGGRYEEAISAYGTTLEKYATSRPYQAIALNRLAQIHEAKGNLAKAADCYELESKVTMNQNGSAEMQARANRLRRRLNQPLNEDLADLIKDRPSAIRFWELLLEGDDYKENNQYQEALSKYEEAYNAYAKEWFEKDDVLMRMGDVNEKMNNYESAIKNYEDASENHVSKYHKAQLRKRIQALQEKLAHR